MFSLLKCSKVQLAAVRAVGLKWTVELMPLQARSWLPRTVSVDSGRITSSTSFGLAP